ncbi:MAG: hypothetical protein QXG15_02320 [Desulfurococcaceae archaeon]
MSPIYSQYMLLVIGYPGNGKTTLANSICYENALEGYRYLYVSFYGDELYKSRAKRRPG